MTDKKLWQMALMDALLTGIYVAGVATLMTYANNLFGPANNALGGTAILMLLVLSAVVVGTLIFGRPLIMYLDGTKREAIKTLFYTILILFGLTILIMIFLVLK